MKKIALIILTMMTIPTYATTMCAVNDTVAVVLDPSIEIKGSSGVDSVNGIWWMPFPYGTLYGTSACINKNQRGVVPLLKDDRDGDGVLRRVIGGEKYGQYCWVKLTHPVSSSWFGLRTYSSIEDCVRSCLTSSWQHFSGMMSGGATALSNRSSLFNSISN